MHMCMCPIVLYCKYTHYGMHTLCTIAVPKEDTVMSIQLPSSITARRFGHHSMGVESEYDAFGEQAPITWICNCGSMMATERYDYDTESYIPTSEARKAEFLANHTSCVATCYHCHTTPVERQGLWCDKCSDDVDDVF